MAKKYLLTLKRAISMYITDPENLASLKQLAVDKKIQRVLKKRFDKMNDVQQKAILEIGLLIEAGEKRPAGAGLGRQSKDFGSTEANALMAQLKGAYQRLIETDEAKKFTELTGRTWGSLYTVSPKASDEALEPAQP